MQGKTAFVTLRFVSEQTNVTRDKAGAVVAGNPQQVDVVTDLWTFARNTRSRDPNWTLVATDTPHETARAYRLDRFRTGHMIDERGAGAQPNLH